MQFDMFLALLYFSMIFHEFCKNRKVKEKIFQKKFSTAIFVFIFSKNANLHCFPQFPQSFPQVVL